MVLLGRAGLCQSQERGELLGACVALMVAFEGLLRPKEMFALHLDDVSFPEDFLVGEGVGGSDYSGSEECKVYGGRAVRFPGR